MLGEYERERVHYVRFEFRDADEAEAFERYANETDSIVALKMVGRLDEAKRVAINTITLGMVSDCLHHIYEALRCMERWKVVVAFNLLRKPLTDSLVYLSWMFSDEDDFYDAFANQSPAGLRPKIVGNRRQSIIDAAVGKTMLKGVVDSDWLNEVLFKPAYPQGLYRIFQHAVHLITAEREEIRTEPENFNFIFKNHTDNDSYHGLYEVLPTVMLFLSHVIEGLFERMHAKDTGARAAFQTRSVLGLYLLSDHPDCVGNVRTILGDLSTVLACPKCHEPLTLTKHNMARLLLAESFRCKSCGRAWPFPFSYIF
ncbi:hypothetical protein [Nitrospirillum pindoramense]|nr:hypothetical protein [Nitrospirillum amazonense]